MKLLSGFLLPLLLHNLKRNGVRDEQVVIGLLEPPGRIAAGAVSPQVMTSMDFLPTLLAAAKGAPAPGYPSDGMNLLPVLMTVAAAFGAVTDDPVEPAPLVPAETQATAAVQAPLVVAGIGGLR